MNSTLEHWIEEAAADARHQSIPADARTVQSLTATSSISLCQYWPTVRPVLVTLQSLIPKAALVIALVISIGDRACPKS